MTSGPATARSQPDYAAFLRQQLATQPRNVMDHLLGDEKVWIRHAGAPHGHGR